MSTDERTLSMSEARRDASTQPLLGEEMTPAQAMVRVLELAGIDHVFGMPGGATGPIFQALYDRSSAIRTVLVREEARAGVMAEVYGRLTGRPGVAIGQGAFLLNASFGAIEAHLAASPMLILTDLSDNSPFSLHAPYQSGAGEYGTFDAKQAFSAITKLTLVANGPVHAVRCLQVALKHAVAGEPGPVAVLVHTHSWKGTVGPDSIPRLYANPALQGASVPCADPADIERAAGLLRDAERPVIISGNGVRMSRGHAEIRRLAETLGAPVASSAAGKSTFPETHDLALGVYGTFGTALANAIVGEADVLLVVGSKLGATDTAFENRELIDPIRQRIIQIDVEPKHLAWVYPTEVSILGDARSALHALTATLSGKVSAERRRKRAGLLRAARQQHGFFNDPELSSAAVPVLPQRVIKDLQSVVRDDAILTCDAGENRLFMTHYFQTKGPETFVQPAAVGAMGYAIPAALAAKLVHPERSVIAFCGDGGFAIGLNGLMTAIEERIPIVTVVLNNQALGWVKHGQGERNIACDFADFDHAAIARAMGCAGFRVERPEEVKPALIAAIDSGRPAVVDVLSSLGETFRKVTSPLAVKRG